jgi:hypothetical protein
MSSLWRCSVCKKAGLEEDFLFVPIDETHETVYCYDCAPEDALKQHWPVDEESNDSDREEVR